MKKTKKIILSSIVFAITAYVVMLSAQYTVQPEYVEAQVDSASETTTPTIRLTGYAWSENIGWISFKDGSVPVKVESDGSLTGYAWSENIGWIKFGGLSDFPITSYESASNAKLTKTSVTSGVLSGWARALAGSSGVNTGGWDGWIALKGVKIKLMSPELARNPSVAFPSGCTSSGCSNGAAWGSDIVGWVDFSGVTTMEQKNDCDAGLPGIRIPHGSNFTFSSEPDADGVCTYVEHSCDDGRLTPALTTTHTELLCEDTRKDCVRAGKTFKHGDKVQFYSKSIAGIGTVCEDFREELTCKNGKFFDKDGNEDDGSTNKHLKCMNNPNYIEQ